MKKSRTKLTGKGVKNAVDAIKAEAKALKDNPPKGPWSRIPTEHPVLKAFIVDQNGRSTNFYDVNPVQWYLDRDDDGTFVWRTPEPCNRRRGLPPVLTMEDLNKVPGFLVSLASACGLDHEVLDKPDLNIVPAHTVMCPLGDRRIKGTDSTLETAGLSPGTFLLLPGHPDECGMVGAFNSGVPYEDSLEYGLTVFSLPRVVRIVSKSSKGTIKA